MKTILLRSPQILQILQIPFRCAKLFMLVAGATIWLCSGIVAQPIRVDYASFCSPTSGTYTEIYYSVDSRYLTFIKDSTGKFSSTAVIRLQITQGDSLVIDKPWKIASSVEDTSKLSLASQTDLVRFALAPGSYQLFVTVVDVPSKRQETASIPLEQKGCLQGKLQFSDIELCSSIVQTENQGSVFYKNTYEVLALPSATFTSSLPVLYFYAETYNLLSLVGDDYRVRASITNAAGAAGGAPVKSQEKMRRRSATSSIEIGTMNINNIPSGTYFLDLEILDSSRTVIASARKKFFVSHPSVQAALSQGAPSADFMKSEFAVMSQEDVDREMAAATYIATEDEKASFKLMISVDDKRRFLFDFWRKRETSSSVPQRHRREMFRTLLEEANQQFRSMGKEGWKTDRGRVLLTYGRPDDIDRFPNSSEYAPYEVWTYNNIDNVQSGVIFIFGDLYGTNAYRLVHSTHQAEVHNEQWMSEVKKQ